MVSFFQAEDGIRALVRSRGLGDVYKRQLHLRQRGVLRFIQDHEGMIERAAAHERERSDLDPVSYTHLTLPPSDLV